MSIIPAVLRQPISKTCTSKPTLLSSINDRFHIYPDLIESKGPDFLADLIPEPPPIEAKYYTVYQQNLYSFDALERLSGDIKSPKFVYAHMYSTHWPFMLRPDGSLRLPFSEKITSDLYIDAVRYTNSRLLDVIDTILANSEVEPVIILQGDHSNGWEGKVEWSGIDRMKILSAFYLPDGGDQLLYDDISPVNNFRLAFKYYFGQDIDLLPDVSHYLDAKSKQIRIAPKTCISDVVKPDKQ